MLPWERAHKSNNEIEYGIGGKLTAESNNAGENVSGVKKEGDRQNPRVGFPKPYAFLLPPTL
jgi:hypothetical protein